MVRASDALDDHLEKVANVIKSVEAASLIAR